MRFSSKFAGISVIAGSVFLALAACGPSQDNSSSPANASSQSAASEPAYAAALTSAMTKAMKAVTGSLKVDLAQFRAMEAFAMFASDLDAASRQQLDRGQRLMALLKQPQYSPYPLAQMTVSLYLGTSGKLDAVPTDDVLRFEQEFLDFMSRQHSDVLDGIRESRVFDDATEEKVDSAYDAFLDQFETSEGQSIKPGTEAKADPVTDDELEQEQIVKQKRD